MVRKCRVLGCTAQCKRTFKFPPANDERLLVWLSATGNKALLKIPITKLMHNVICGHHFEPKYQLAKKLSTSTIPTLHLPEPIDASQYLKTWDKENQHPPKKELPYSLQEESRRTQVCSSLQNRHDDNNNEGLQLSHCNMSPKESQRCEVPTLSSFHTASSSSSSDRRGDSFEKLLSDESFSTSDFNPEYTPKTSGSKGNQHRRLHNGKGIKRTLLLKRRKLLRFLIVNSEEDQQRNMFLHKEQQLLKRFKTLTHKAVTILTKLYNNILRSNQRSSLQRFPFGIENLLKTIHTDVLLRCQKQSQHQRSSTRKNRNVLSRSA